MESIEILKMIEELIEYCKSDKAKRSEIIRQLKELYYILNGELPFD